jgi:hypothetical protein
VKGAAYMNNIQFPADLSWTASPQEDFWIEKQLTGMSPKEKLLLKAAIELTPVKTAVNLINLTFQLDCYELCYSAKDERELGEYVARYLEYGKYNALAYIDRERLGQHYRTRQAPGVFVDGAYVFPNELTVEPVYNGSNLPELEEGATV